eukprot:scaffold678596_cov114-Attheya_sp.AAC.1
MAVQPTIDTSEGHMVYGRRRSMMDSTNATFFATLTVMPTLAATHMVTGSPLDALLMNSPSVHSYEHSFISVGVQVVSSTAYPKPC